MDEELKKLIESTAAETRERFDRLETQIAETRQHVDEAAVETRRHVDEVAVETRRHVDEVAVETRRHFEVVAGSLEKKIDIIAEGVITVNQRVDRVEERLAAEMAAGFNDLRAMIKFSHHELDRRLRTLEDVVSDLQTRVERLESTTH